MSYTKKIIWDFETQTDHVTSAIRVEQAVINKNKRICHLVDFADPMDH